ncbi:hypothetical protein EBS40_10005, partial [bacterium]|nr:hypothetical protein [bacterium]
RSPGADVGGSDERCVRGATCAARRLQIEVDQRTETAERGLHDRVQRRGSEVRQALEGDVVAGAQPRILHHEATGAERGAVLHRSLHRRIARPHIGGNVLRRRERAGHRLRARQARRRAGPSRGEQH